MFKGHVWKGSPVNERRPREEERDDGGEAMAELMKGKRP